eukprot:gene1253-32600_t
MELVSGKHDGGGMEDEEALKEDETADMVIDEHSRKGSKDVSRNSLGTGSSTDSGSGVACAVLNTVKSIAPTKEASAGKLATPNPLYCSIQSLATPDAGALTEDQESAPSSSSKEVERSAVAATILGFGKMEREYRDFKTRRLQIPPSIGYGAISRAFFHHGLVM